MNPHTYDIYDFYKISWRQWLLYKGYPEKPETYLRENKKRLGYFKSINRF